MMVNSYVFSVQNIMDKMAMAERRLHYTVMIGEVETIFIEITISKRK